MKFFSFTKLITVLCILKSSMLFKGDKVKPITVHLIPHSHMDAGWLMSADQYYYGEHSSKYCVKCIFDSLLKSLNKNNERTFTVSDIYYFNKWYANLQEIEKLEIRKLVSSGRIEFVNGGWVMHDEATTNYNQILDQIRLGVEFLLREFKVRPRVAWQLDPFGHSNTNVRFIK